MGVFDGLDRLDARFAPRLQARPEFILIVAAVVFSAGAGVHATRYDPGGAPLGGPPTAEIRVMDAPDARPPTGGITVVGPEPGQAAGAYVATRQDAIRELAAANPLARTVAIASFERFLTPAETQELVDALTLRVTAVRYRLPSTADATVVPPRRVELPGDGEGLQAVVVAALHADAAAAREDAADLEEMIASTDDEDFRLVFESDQAQLLAAADAVGRSGCPCIYALEVSGSLAQLARLAEQRPVRLVDPAPLDHLQQAVVLLAVLPE